MFVRTDILLHLQPHARHDKDASAGSSRTAAGPAERDGAFKADSGHEDDFTKFYKREIAHLVRYLMLLGASTHEAQDAAQEAMVALYQVWGTVKFTRAWVRRVATRAHFRLSARHGDMLQRAAAAGWLPSDVQDLGDGDPTEAASVMVALSKLPQAQREVVTLTMDGFTPREIAEVLKKSTTAVRSSLYLARTRLKELLKDATAEEVPALPTSTANRTE